MASSWHIIHKLSNTVYISQEKLDYVAVTRKFKISGTEKKNLCLAHAIVLLWVS